MTLTSSVLLLVTGLNVILGVVVAAYNPSRPQNRQFAFFSHTMALWSLCILLAVTRDDLTQAVFWIRASSASAALIPFSFYRLCLAIAMPAGNARAILRRSWPLASVCMLSSIIAFTPRFLLGARLPAEALHGMAFPEPIYGPLFAPFNLLILAAFLWTMVSFVRSMVRSTGVQRTELQFILLGMLLTMLFSFSTNIFLPMITGSAQTQPLGPLGGLAMNLTIAYGIATRRIMDAAGVLRRVVAYSLLIGYLVVVFFFTHEVIRRFTPAAQQPIIASLLAAIIVGLSMAPAQAFMQRVADWLFASTRSMRLAHAVEAVTSSLQTVSTLPELVAGFVTTVSTLTGAQQVTLMLERKRQFEQAGTSATPLSTLPPLHETGPLPRALGARPLPVLADALLRERQTPEVQALRAELARMKCALAMGIRTRGQLIGILLIAPRVSGRIYASEDQRNLQRLCNHLGIAVENARLYTESVEHRLRSVTLLNNLVNGVVAADVDGEITMINREAQRLCRLSPLHDRALRLPDMPAPVTLALQRALEHGAGQRDVDAEIDFGDGSVVPVRIGTSPFHDPDGRVMGALAVLSDQTTVRKLESQIRRTDRLASVGTLAAGMAHEIKNPLVTINTFTQLLPDRYADPEFRGTFTELVRHEVQRMNGLVNQLLRFARPSPPLLSPLNLSDVLDHSLLLMEQQLLSHRIRLEKRYESTAYIIRADANQLEQAFVNFLLNAIQAMPPDGRLTVDMQRPAHPANPAGWAEEPAPATVQVAIRDTGCGIAAEHLNSIFDPFFTTRSEGTGLGLSVAHGIVTEHGGSVEVTSKLGVGTTFTIVFPLLEQEAAV